MSKKGHHGGAWKVAYADFTTAMMALFLCLWLTAQDNKIKEAIERAFRNPFGAVTKESVGILPNKDVQATHQQHGNFDSPSAAELELMRRITDDLARLLQEDPDNPNNSIKLELTPEGLRINVFNRSQKPIFEPGTATFTQYGAWVFSTLAWEIARYRTFKIELEGHSAKEGSPDAANYGHWELSADRANAARRKVLEGGVQESQICKVAGFADRQPMANSDPASEVNNRVSVLIKYQHGERLM
jgi:chemotaxis protein MotB